MLDTNTAGGRLLLALKDAGIRQSDIAKRLNISRPAVSSLYAGQRLLKFEEANALMDMLPPPEAIIQVPIIGLAGAGNWLEAIESSSGFVPVPAEMGTVGKFAVQMVGESMNQVLPDGSYAVIDPDDVELYSGKLYLLRNAEGEVTIKRHRTDPSRFEPVSDDPTFVPFLLGGSDFRVIGRVTFAVRRF